MRRVTRGQGASVRNGTRTSSRATWFIEGGADSRASDERGPDVEATTAALERLLV